MGKRGPKGKPKAIRIFEGDPGHLLESKHAGEVNPPSIRIPPAPEWLGEVGVAIWNEQGPRLFSIGLLTEIDCGAFAIYCEAWDEFREALKDIAKSGSRTCKSDKGVEYQHPMVAIKNKAAQRIKQFGAEFGMTPVSRIGLKPDAQGGGDLESFKQSG